MGNCVEKQRQRELAKRALKREELVRYFLGPGVGGGGGGNSSKVALRSEGALPDLASRVSTPQLTETPVDELTPAVEAPPSDAAASASTSGTGTALTLAAAAVLAARAALADADEPSSWQLTDRQREAALFAMENDGIERLHDNAELQLEQRRERQRREERAGNSAAYYHGGGGGGGGYGLGAPGFHGGGGGGARHVSFGELGNRPTGYRK